MFENLFIIKYWPKNWTLEINMYVLSCVQLFVTPSIAPRQAPSVHGDSPGKNTWEGCHALLQGIFPTQGWNPSLLHLLHCRQILYCWAIREALLRYLLFCCLVWLAYTFIFFCCPWSVMSTSGFSPFYLYKMSLE